MFNRPKVDPTHPVPAPVKQPAITGGAAMMLKSMGIDPAQMEALTEAFLNDVSKVGARLDALEKSNADLRAMIEAQTALLQQIAAR